MIWLQRRGSALLLVAIVTLTNLRTALYFQRWTNAAVVPPKTFEEQGAAALPTSEESLSQRTMVVPEDPRPKLHTNGTVVSSFQGNKGMNRLLASYLKGGNLFCETIDQLRRDDPTVFIQFQIKFGCQDLFEQKGGGTGNYLALLYGIRLAAEVYGDVELQFTCHDAEQTRHRLILPWLMGFYPARSRHLPSAFLNLTLPDACAGASRQPLGYMVPAMQQDFRYMAVQLVGRSAIPEEVRQSYDVGSYDTPSFVPQLSSSNSRSMPPYHNVSFDEAVTHFRCGDLIDSRHASFSFMNFRGYTRHISPNVTSIGILTQPLANDTVFARRMDATDHIRDRCRLVVHALNAYIEERFPQATVRMHHDEPIALTYARILLAQQAVAGISTFPVVPVVSTFGTGYIRAPDRPEEVNHWLLLPPRLPVVLTDDPKMPVRGIKILWRQKGETGVLDWFRNDAWTG